MHLSELEVHYFRSLYDAALPLKPITILIGPNASGKSNLLRALRFLYDGVSGDRLDWQAYDAHKDELRWYGYDEYGQRPEGLEFALRFADAAPLAAYEATLHCGDYLSVARERLSVQLHEGATPAAFFEREGEAVRQCIGKRGEPLKNPYRGQARSARLLHLRDEGPNLTHSLARAVYAHIAGWRFVDVNLPQARREAFVPQHPEEVPPLAGDASNLSAFLWALYRRGTDDFDTLAAAMAEFIELPQKILVEHDAERGGQAARYGFVEQPFGESRLIPPASMSDGAIRLLALLALLLGDRSVRLACLEEPDQGLHPRLMLYLADVMRQAVERPALSVAEGSDSDAMQIIVTTHSPEFMDCFDLEREQDYLQVYVAERDELGKTILTPATAQAFAPWLKKYRLGEAVRRRFV